MVTPPSPWTNSITLKIIEQKSYIDSFRSFTLFEIYHLITVDMFYNIRTPKDDTHCLMQLIICKHTNVLTIECLFSAGPKQAALKLEFKKYNRRYITFNFKGKGNAQLQFFNSDSSKSFKVHISYSYFL